jgi:hypothetical protein
MCTQYLHLVTFPCLFPTSSLPLEPTPRQDLSAQDTSGYNLKNWQFSWHFLATSKLKGIFSLERSLFSNSHIPELRSQIWIQHYALIEPNVVSNTLLLFRFDADFEMA